MHALADCPSQLISLLVVLDLSALLYQKTTILIHSRQQGNLPFKPCRIGSKMDLDLRTVEDVDIQYT